MAKYFIKNKFQERKVFFIALLFSLGSHLLVALACTLPFSLHRTSALAGIIDLDLFYGKGIKQNKSLRTALGQNKRKSVSSSADKESPSTGGQNEMTRGDGEGEQSSSVKDVDNSDLNLIYLEKIRQKILLDVQNKADEEGLRVRGEIQVEILFSHEGEVLKIKFRDDEKKGNIQKFITAYFKEKHRFESFPPEFKEKEIRLILPFSFHR